MMGMMRMTKKREREKKKEKKRKEKKREGMGELYQMGNWLFVKIRVEGKQRKAWIGRQVCISYVLFGKLLIDDCPRKFDNNVD